ncbi:MAG: AAA family ATPase [Turicibacter sp.]|nr:AAA family ATPase [Turicibacter sp.]
MFKIPYGESNFERLRTKNFLYVDKTHFIESLEMLYYVIHLRPRRFGKSLFVDMLDNYYDVNSADKFDTLFSGLYIHENPTENQNNYYVLRFDFSGIQNTASENLEQGFLRRVKMDVEMFIDRYKLAITLNNVSSPASVLDSLLKGFHALALKEQIYIMIDEYDHFTNSLLSGDGEEFLAILTRGGFVRSFYEVIKRSAGAGLVGRLFVTGVMSVTLDSMTSGFNIATKITTEASFADMMGFTTDEVKDLLKLSYVVNPGKAAPPVALTEKEQEDVYGIFRENYNGYLFSETSESKVFNSTLIMYFLQKYLPRKDIPRSLIDPNLNQTGTTIQNIVELKNSEQNYQIIEEIITNKQIGGTLQPFINIDAKFDHDDLITLLFNIGMLTIKGFDMEMQFEIPNKIIESIYL